MGRLFAVVVTVIALISAAVFALHIWWLPPDISTHGGRIDRQLNETMVTAGILFVAAQLALAVFVWRSSVRDGTPPRAVKTFPGGVTPMVVLAIVLVGIEILVLTFVGSKVWASVYQTPAPAGALQIEVQAEQFAFYFRYAGPDGKFGAMHPDLMNDATQNFFGLDPANDTTARDDIVVGTLVIPVNQPIELRMHAKDVNHSFYVPELRIQQDFVPGMVIPLHFTATQTGRYELVCTQLCGLGHYNMRAFVEVKTPADFAQWLKAQAATS
jgi:cytochrome c oxidase subunit II